MLACTFLQCEVCGSLREVVLCVRQVAALDDAAALSPAASAVALVTSLAVNSLFGASLMTHCPPDMRPEAFVQDDLHHALVRNTVKFC